MSYASFLRLPLGPDRLSAGVLSRLQTDGGRVLILAAPALIPEWGALLGALCHGTGLRVEAARSPARAARRLGEDALDVLIAAPETALALHTRSALGPERFTCIVFAWPEEWDADEAVAAVLQDLPKDTQRVVFTSHAERLDGGEGVVERYARKAVVLGRQPAAAPGEMTRATGPVRTLAASWSGRATAIAALIDAVDPVTLTVWTADNRDHAMIENAVAGSAGSVAIATRTTPTGGAIVCYDLPTTDLLRELVAAGEVTLIVPPGCERYTTMAATPRRPLLIETPVASQLDRDAHLRAEIVRALGSQPQASALYALAPLFELYDSQLVAAALFRLWQGAQARQGAATEQAAPASRPESPASGGATQQLWVGVGKRDEATTGDLVAVLVKEVGLDRTLIGKIELRDTFCLVEVPASEAERVARGLTGKTIRRRKLSARIDKGPVREGPGGGKPPFRARSPR